MRSSARRASTWCAVRASSRGQPGELVTLLAVNGPAEAVRTEGLVYPLRGETLEPGSSRGVSNVFADRRPASAVERGVLLVSGRRTASDNLSQGGYNAEKAEALALFRVLAAALGILPSRWMRRRNEGPTDVVLVTHDSFAISQDVKQAFEDGERPEAEDPQGRRRGRGRDASPAHRREPRGRRAVRHRQQPRRARSRRRRLRAVRVASAHGGRSGARARRRASRDADRPRRGLPELRQGMVRESRPRAAARPRRRRRSPRYRELLVVENPATSTPGLAFMLATIARFGEGLAGLLAQAASQRRARRGRLGRGLHGPLSGPSGVAGSGRSWSPTRRARRPR